MIKNNVNSFFTQCNGSVLFLAQSLVARNLASVHPVSMLNKAVAHAVNVCKRKGFCAGQTSSATQIVHEGYATKVWFAYRLDGLFFSETWHSEYGGPTRWVDAYWQKNAQEVDVFVLFDTLARQFRGGNWMFLSVLQRDRSLSSVKDQPRVCDMMVRTDSVFFRCHSVSQLEQHGAIVPHRPDAPHCPFDIVIDHMPTRHDATVTATAFFKQIRPLDDVVFTKNHLAYLYDAFFNKIKTIKQ